MSAGSWAGPFTVPKQPGWCCGDTEFVAVVDALGRSFAYVLPDDCVGGWDGAKARATLIAEALNKDQPLSGRKLPDGVAVDQHGVLRIDIPRNSGLTGVSVSLPKVTP